MIYEWLERNRKDIDILTSFLVTAIPIIMLYSEALGINETTITYCILMVVLGIASHYASRIRGEGDVEYAEKKAKTVLGYPTKKQTPLENNFKLINMYGLKKKIIICNFAKTISSGVLTAIAINIIMANANKYALVEGIIPFALAVVIVALIDLYQYRYEREDEVNMNDLEKRIQELENQQ